MTDFFSFIWGFWAGPWLSDPEGYFWIIMMGSLVTASCALAGNYLIVRKLSLMGDTLSHSVLPGLALAFLLTGRKTSLIMFLGAILAALLTALLVELIHKTSRIKQDSAMNVVFSTFFAVGVVLITVFADRVDLDQECVLYGEIVFVPLEPLIQWGSWIFGPPSVVRMAIVLGLTLLCVVLAYKELLITAFDGALATSLGISAYGIHLVFMALVSIIIVSAFESVGAILVVAMLILPGATASLLSHRMFGMHLLAFLHAIVSTVLGVHAAVWWDTSVAAAMVCAGSVLFGLAWLFSPQQGLLFQYARRKRLALRLPKTVPMKD